MREQKQEFLVRKYCSRDRERVRAICCDTGFMGQPQERYFRGRDVFADMWTNYWIDHEPESCFVVEYKGEVVGYLLGCVDTQRQEEIFRREIAPALLRKALWDGIFFYPLNLRYFYRLIRSNFRREFNVPMRWIKKEYPAHLHMNIGPKELRGKGMGKALVNAYVSYLRERGVIGVHLATTSNNKDAVPFYQRVGFKEIFRGPLSCYDHIVSEKMSLIYFGMKL